MSKLAFSGVIVLLGICSATLIGYIRASINLADQSELMSKNEALTRSIAQSLLVRDRLEGMEISPLNLRTVRTTQGTCAQSDSVLSTDESTPTLLMLLSINGCLACIDQELNILSQDSALSTKTSRLRVRIVSPDSLFDLVRFSRLRHITYPCFQDIGNVLRSSIGLREFVPIELFVVKGKILYANNPEVSDREKSLHFFTKIKRTLGIVKTAF